jgi:hypothetical protein
MLARRRVMPEATKPTPGRQATLFHGPPGQSESSKKNTLTRANNPLYSRHSTFLGENPNEALR